MFLRFFKLMSEQEEEIKVQISQRLDHTNDEQILYKNKPDKKDQVQQWLRNKNML